MVRGAFEPAYPDFAEDLQFGAGLGGRYYTPLGPLRFDVAGPLNKRDGNGCCLPSHLSTGPAPIHNSRCPLAV